MQGSEAIGIAGVDIHTRVQQGLDLVGIAGHHRIEQLVPRGKHCRGVRPHRELTGVCVCYEEREGKKEE